MAGTMSSVDHKGNGQQEHISEAYAAALAALEEARADAERMRLEADRYRRQRQLQAEVVLGKARRVLRVAEQKAVQMLADARRRAEEEVDAVLRIDLDALVAAEPGISVDPAPEPVEPPATAEVAAPAADGPDAPGAHDDDQVELGPDAAGEPDLDDIVISAVSAAVHRALEPYQPSEPEPRVAESAGQSVD